MILLKYKRRKKMSKTLIAYFSATGTTKRAASVFAKAADADLFEIVPEVPYKRADLNWMDENSRTTKEMKDKSSRPAIASNCKVEDMSCYDTIIIGFPIWWYVAPTIINTFLEQYDLSGKKIVLFATSGMSGMGETVNGLKDSAHGAVIAGGKRVTARISEAEVRAWLNTLDI